MSLTSVQCNFAGNHFYVLMSYSVVCKVAKQMKPQSLTILELGLASELAFLHRLLTLVGGLGHSLRALVLCKNYLEGVPTLL